MTPRTLQRAAALALAAGTAMLLLACATTAPAPNKHAGIDTRGKKCGDCHERGKPVKRSAASGGYGGGAAGAPAPNYEQGPGR